MRTAAPHLNSIVDALRMSDRDLSVVITALAERDEHNAAAETVRRPAPARNPDDLPRTLVRICHQRGNCVTYLVKPRDIHEHGMVFLHGSYVHEGAECIALLRDRDGRPAQLPAMVFRCRHIAGRIHEITAVFDKPVPIDDFRFHDGRPLQSVHQSIKHPDSAVV